MIDTDCVTIGAVSAGCVLANRWTAGPNTRVNEFRTQACSPDVANAALEWQALLVFLRAARGNVRDNAAAALTHLDEAIALAELNRQRGHALTIAAADCRVRLVGWQVRRIIAYVDENLATNLTVTSMADHAELSPSHFHRAFKQSFGMSPRAYVMHQRIRKAAALMLDSRCSLAEVALNCGMCDQSHFTRVFKRVAGLSPGAWRRRFTPKLPTAG